MFIKKWEPNYAEYEINKSVRSRLFENKDKDEISNQEVIELEYSRPFGVSDLSYVQASEAMWAWLNLAIGPAATSARNTFDLTPTLNGADLWRRLVKPTSNKSLVRRNLIRDKVQQPKRAPNMAVLMEYVQLYEKDEQLFLNAGASQQSHEGRCAQL